MDLHAFIVENIDALLDDWAAFARTLPSCKDLSVDELRGRAQAMLRAVAADLSLSQTPGEPLARSHGLAPRLFAWDARAQAHGGDRFMRGLGLNELVAEFRALRASVVRQWTALRGPASVEMLEQLVRFNEGIDQAFAESLARFVTEVRRKDEAELQRRDAESRRLREQELRARRAEERLHAALREARMTHWEWDPEADRVAASPTMDALLGLRPGETVASSMQGFGLLHPDDRPHHQALVMQAVRNGKGWHARFRIIRPCDGQVAWLEERARPVADPSGGVLITGVVRDITEQKAAEEALKRNEQTVVDLIEHAPFGVYVVDSRMRIARLNHRSQEGAFRNVRPAIGRDLGEALHTVWPEPVAADILAAFRHTLDTGEPFVSPGFINRRADMDAIESYEWQLHRIVLPDGQPGVVCYSFDSTQLRTAEEALRQANWRKDRFLATLAHELRNPLAPIRQAAAIARSDAVAAAQVRWSIDVIDRQAVKMALLLDDLLDVSRITRGRLELRRRLVDVADAVRSAIETVTPLIQARRHELRAELPNQPLLLQADPLRLSQVVANLLTNAARYSEPGNLIGLAVRRRGEAAEITVSDHGVGIAQDQLEAVFEMFGQGSAPAALREGGLGVGLALARGLVELHGGSLEAHSEGMGRGSEFVVRLPIAVQTALPEKAHEPEPAEAAEAERVLVIDDNADAADSLAELLRLQGHEVRTAHSGEAGIASAAAFQPNLVLLDLGMPRMDGYEVARRLRAMEGGARLTLVAVSGWGQASDRRQTAVAGIDYHLTKPLEEGQLQPAFVEARRRKEVS
jgi:PAS domain S-box-containing protein